MSTQADPSVVIGGLTIEQVAGVHAALADRIALCDVLAQEGIDPAKWPDAERAWREALVESPDLQLRYAQRKREAEDCLAREVAPLADDPVAWTGLLAAVSTADDPAAILRALDLGMSDFGRLGRVWRRKAAADPNVAKQLGELAGKSPPPKSVRTSPARLSRFPWSPGGAANAEPAAPPSAARPAAPSNPSRLSTPVGGVLPIASDLDLYAALSVLLELAPELKGAALSLCGVDAKAHAGLVATWTDRLEDPKLGAEFTVKKLDHRDAVTRIIAGAKPIASPSVRAPT